MRNGMKVFGTAIFAGAMSLSMVALAAEWDLTKGLPANCSTRKFTSIVPGKGLEPAQIADRNRSAAGVVVGDGFVLPEAFVLEAEFTPYCDWTNENDRAAADAPSRQHML